MTDIARYRVLQELLAPSSASRLHRGERLADGLPVLLKTHHGKQDAALRLRREHEVFGGGGAHLARTVELLDDDGVLTLVLEDRGHEPLPQGRPLPVDAAVRVARDLAAGLDHLHHDGIVHLGIEPRAVFLHPRTGEAAIVDVSRSGRLLGGIANDVMVAGDVDFAYLAPELADASAAGIDHRADLYALGATLYALLSGAPPLSGPSPARSALPASIPAGVARIVAHLLEVDPEDRYQSAAGLLVDLEACLGSLAQGGEGPRSVGQHDLAMALDFEVASLSRALRAVSESVTEGDLLPRLLRTTAASAQATGGFVIVKREGAWLFEADLEVPCNVARSGLSVPVEAPELRLPTKLLDAVRDLRAPIVVHDAESDELFPDEALRTGAARALLCVPLVHRDDVGAILVLTSDVTGAFRAEHVEAVRIVAQHAAVCLENARAHGKLRRLNADLSERCERAVEAARQKDDLVGSVSHELRTPLNGLVNIPETLLQDFAVVRTYTCGACGQSFHDAEDGALDASPEPCPACDSVLQVREDHRFKGDPREHRFFLRQMMRAGEHLRLLLNEFLDYARMEAGRMRLNLEPVRVADLFDEVALYGARLTETGKAQLHFDAAPGLALVADRVKLSQVLLNLVGNAVKHARRASPIRIEARPLEDGARVRFTVADDGQGIPTEKLERIFESFQQIEEQQAKPHAGVGLGLAICRRLVQMHGGRIWAESQQGLGASFHVEVPVEPHVAVTDRPAASASFVAGTVLLIDDDPEYRNLATRALHSIGYDVHEASDARDALEAVKRLRPAAILLDVMLPRVNGIWLVQRFKADAALRDIPVIVSSAFHENHEVIASLGARWLPKPWTQGELAAELAAVRRTAPVSPTSPPSPPLARGVRHGA